MKHSKDGIFRYSLIKQKMCKIEFTAWSYVMLTDVKRWTAPTLTDFYEHWRDLKHLASEDVQVLIADLWHLWLWKWLWEIVSYAKSNVNILETSYWEQRKWTTFHKPPSYPLIHWHLGYFILAVLRHWNPSNRKSIQCCQHQGPLLGLQACHLLLF